MISKSVIPVSAVSYTHLNMKELYLYRRLQGFIKSRISRKSVSQIFCDDLQTEKVKYILHGESG